MRNQVKQSIDLLWEDVTTYQTRLKLRGNRVANRMLVFPAGIKEEALREYILESLPDIIQIISFIEIEDGWLPKREKLQEHLYVGNTAE